MTGAADVEALIKPGAKIRPTPALRFKQIGDQRVLQQRWFVEDDKAVFHIWRVVPTVNESTED